MVLPYKYHMGILVDGIPIPDPSEWTFQIGDLDTKGSRDCTGYLHRAYVATKINYEFQWKGLEWDMLQQITAAVLTPKFTLVAPNPSRFNEMHTGEYYVGDRTGNAHYFWIHTDAIGLFTLHLKMIEY